MQIIIVIDSPGSEGELVLEVTPEQLIFLEELSNRWNKENKYHSQPSIEIAELGNGHD